ncbi:hypothetical protein DJ90_6385 [Paenibacillus macerans]|uniref:Uncharacterized protein n=1 Tax=Paenibacillus macerans TaxID=44252 RepID=A0A090XVL1_PAEMA|nr:hypothetical protein DJ90_6385 [Paenibacillus macerans]
MIIQLPRHFPIVRMVWLLMLFHGPRPHFVLEYVNEIPPLKTAKGLEWIQAPCSLNKLTTHFFNSRCFTAQCTKIVQLRTTHFTTASHFDFIDFRGMKRESSFHAYTVGNFTNRKSFADSAAATLDNNTFEQLDTFTRSLDNLNEHFQSVTRTKARNIFAKLFLRNRLYDIHL